MACQVLAAAENWLTATLPALDWARAGTAAGGAYALVALAEFGDKSQLVCMTLAARHRHWPIFWGAAAAFALLNAIAVAFGAAVGQWLPERTIALAVAVLFAVFGLKSLLTRPAADDETVAEPSGHGLFVTTFLMIFLAELGDKTQLAVAGLGAAEPPLLVWLGATAALVTTSALGIWAGKMLLRRIPPRALHIAAGLLFLVFALFAAGKAWPPGGWEAWRPV